MFISNDYRFYRYQYSVDHHTDMSSGCDVHYLAMLTKGSATGLSPNQYRQHILCERAMELLTTTDLTVQAISEQLRFSSPSYFRKVFFRCTGQTPRQFSANGGKTSADTD